MIAKTIGLVTYKKSQPLTESDSLLTAPLAALGFKAEAVPWDDNHLNWSNYDTLILRSCWNYHLYPEKFLAWLAKIEKLNIKLWNPAKIVRWNINKKYLFDLEKKGFDVVPSKLINANAVLNFDEISQQFDCSELIIKPAIGASAYGLKRINKTAKLRLPDSGFLIQPYLAEIKNGELSLLFFGNSYSHAVIKYPKKNGFLTQIELGGTELLYHPDPSIISCARKIVDSLSTPLLYARVDGILLKGKFTLMELELIEPHLFLDLYPQSAAFFAQTLERFRH